MQYLLAAVLIWEQTKAPQWYEKVTGVIAIPAAITACAYSYLLIKKTRLESRKIELEIEQQRTALAGVDTVQFPVSNAALIASQETSEQSLRNRLVLMLILRYILWRLVMECYDWITAPIHWLATGTTIFGSTLLRFFRPFADTDSLRIGLMAAGLGIQMLVSALGSFVIFLAFGWPLFKDINQLLGIKFADYSPTRLFQMFRQKK